MSLSKEEIKEYPSNRKDKEDKHPRKTREWITMSPEENTKGNDKREEMETQEQENGKHRKSIIN